MQENPRCMPAAILAIANCHISAMGDQINFVFGSRVGFSGTADRTALFPVRSNPRWRLAAILKISNGHILATGHPIHFVFYSMVGFFGYGGSNGANSGWLTSKMAADRHLRSI